LLQKPYGKEVDLWSLGVIIYLLLARVLPFDDEDDKEIAKQTIYDPVDFSFSPWDKVSAAGRELVKKLLEKNRSKRPTLEEVLKDKWFADFKEIHDIRSKNDKAMSKFEQMTMTEPKSPKIQAEKDRVIKSMNQ
jgi:calcium-dependent protein kinase